MLSLYDISVVCSRRRLHEHASATRSRALPSLYLPRQDYPGLPGQQSAGLISSRCLNRSSPYLPSTAVILASCALAVHCVKRPGLATVEIVDFRG